MWYTRLARATPRAAALHVKSRTLAGRQPLAAQLPYREREPLQPVACMALYPCIQTSPMWLLAVAHGGSEARVRVLDVTDLVARIRISSRGGAAPLRVRRTFHAHLRVPPVKFRYTHLPDMAQGL